MAARFRKVGVTTLGACAGLGLAGWALNPFDRQYAVSCIAFNAKFNCGLSRNGMKRNSMKEIFLLLYRM